MRQLSEQEVAREAAKIRNEDIWPNYPILPMKHLYRRGAPQDRDDDLGLVFADDLTMVYLMNLFDLEAGKTLGELRQGKPTEKFDTVEDMVRAGWVGD